MYKVLLIKREQKYKRDNSFISDFSHQKVCMDRGVTYALGEQWLQNNCTKCYCVNGKTMCADLPCPPINCKFMSKVPGKCCPVCVGKRRFTKIYILLHQFLSTVHFY